MVVLRLFGSRVDTQVASSFLQQPLAFNMIVAAEGIQTTVGLVNQACCRAGAPKLVDHGGAGSHNLLLSDCRPLLRCQPRQRQLCMW